MGRLAIAVALLAPTLAQAQTGAITGTVTDEATGLPLAGVHIWIYGPNAVGLNAIVLTDVSGVYTAASLPAGQYWARAVTPVTRNYLDELYDNVAFCHVISGCDVSTGTPIAVGAGSTTSGIDFALTPGGVISGTITDAVTGAPIAGVSVTAVPSIGAVPVSFATTDAAGQYYAVKLPTGSWIIRAAPPSGSPYTPAVYNNGTPVPVTVGTTQSGFNFLLSTGGRLSGTVTDSVTGGPLSVQVLVLSQAGETVANVNSSAGGFYDVDHLAPGLYDVIAGPSSPTHYGQTAEDVAVFENVTTTRNFALDASSSIFGWVRNTSGQSLSSNVELRTAAGALVATVSTAPASDTDPPQGMFFFSQLPFGSYVIRTRGDFGYIDEAFDNIPCLPDCPPATGTVLTAAPGVNFNIEIRLQPGGGISGMVTDAVTGAPLHYVVVNVYAANGALVAQPRSLFGFYSTQGLPPGTYYARTSNSAGYRDEIYNDLAFCNPGCDITAGQPIVVTPAGLTSGIDFALTPGTNLVQNGSFAAGLANWGLFATPDLSYIVANVSFRALQFHRLPPPPGTANQAVVLQQTGAALAAGVGLLAQFEVGNSSMVRKRITVLLHDSDFSDLSTCTFWVPPNTPRRQYGIRAHTTKPWANATIAFYAASAGSNGGSYELSGVSLVEIPAATTPRADCFDALAAGIAGEDGPTMLVNGDFSSGAIAPWGVFGQINGAVTNGVFEFVKVAGTPAGVILQLTGQPVFAGEVLTATFDLGNPSSLRQRVTVLLHDSNFSDLSACTFWIPAGQPLSTYTFRTFATQAWASATISIYPATVAPPGQWVQLDNVTLRRTVWPVLTGTECIEPESAVPPSIIGARIGATPAAVVHTDDHRVLRLDPRLWLGSAASAAGTWRIRVEVSTDGVTWNPGRIVATDDGELEVDLSLYAGETVLVRFLFDLGPPR